MGLNKVPDNNPHVSGITAGGAGGFFVWSPRPPARLPIPVSAIGYYNPAYSLTARSGCPDDWVHRHLLPGFFFPSFFI
jgi:hypothetical protein